MIIAKKANRQYVIDASQEDNYVALGYDIYVDGKIVRNGAGKTIPHAKHEATLQALDLANKKIAELTKELDKAKKALAKAKK